MSLKVAQTVFAAALCSAALLSTGPASAAVYHGTWDPAIDPTAFPNTGWRASADLNVPDTCLAALGPGTVLLTGLNFGSYTDCANIQVRNATLEIYPLNDPVKSAVWTYNFGTFLTQGYAEAASGTPTDSFLQEVQDVTVRDGLVVEFMTTGSFAKQVPPSGAVDLMGSTQLAVHLSSDPITSYVLYGAVIGGGPAKRSSVAPIVTFAQVPEPGTLALAALALAAAAGAGCSRRRARARG